VLGRGKLGTALARQWQQSGQTVSHLKGHPPWRRLPAADVYVLAIPDGALSKVGQALGPQLPRSASVFHCAGSRSHEELSSLRAHGAAIGVLHPLVSFADRKRPPDLAGTTFVIQGDARAKRRAKQLARAVSARTLESDAMGPAYHAAAALVANAGVSLAWSGLEILVALGFPPKQATHALAGLLASVAENVRHVGLPAALTGPVVRGDANTVAAHLAALNLLDPRLAQTYATLQELVIRCAAEAGLSAPDAARIRSAVARRSSPHAPSKRALGRASEGQRKT
jgi:predicted short-subunit dehydrogenase-like oxidoreductase (DUF2520 family)